MKDPDLHDSLAVAAEPPNYSGDPLLDRLYDMLLRLTLELAVTREEVAALRAALRASDPELESAITTASSDPTFAGEQLKRHGELVKNILGDLPGKET